MTNKIQDTFGLDLAIVVILAILLLIFALTLPDGNILRIVFGLPFLLFLPGYSLVSALWSKKTDLDGLERVALSLGLSIAMVPLIGLGLNYTPWGITLTSILISIFSLILILVGITWFRRSQLKPEERFTLPLDIISDNINAISSSDKILVLISAIVIVIGGAMLFYIVINPPTERFTELYILDENGTTENYPSILDLNESSSIIITVVSHEGQKTYYNIEVNLEPETGDNITLAEYSFSLTDDEEWQQEIDFSINESGKFKLLVELFKENENTPYSTNHIWIDVEE
ncbi:MAG: DUF1616 domain-containing protein [Thermoplasmata archaeon]|nr:MAG: DUF1616 domain-containing protein [Thermoplasmata archaeon]